MYQYYTTHDRDDHPQAYELTEGSAIEGEGEVEQQEPQEGTNTGCETSQGDVTEETNANNIATPRRQPPMAPKTGKTTIIKKTNEIMMELMAQFNDDLTQAQIPSTTSIMDQFNVRSVDQAKQINRKLRYKKEEAWTEYFANKQLARTSKQKRIHVAQLKEVPQPPTSEDMYEKCSIKINQSKVQKRMIEILRQHKTDFKQRSEEGLMIFIQKQNWKHICIRDATDEKGKGVFATDDMIKAGDVVCDYHGAIRTAQEAERRLKDLLPPICNYMLFFRNKHGTKMCVDASTECECHPPGEYLHNSPGRYVNHSAKKQNLKPMRREVNGTEVVLLVATRDIKAEEELLFDYGARRSEDGEKLDWLHA
ncbi:N-lysine methyltransferase KMT5A-like [Mercenaria mercenaria]|uniref:N-lysine methyltransferase KMT5A-like n=1 Tax=Mercenaria mercenaria TaxID=6596 RepID=UPI00234EFF92|nr:N-lysine methyltransferase KMT5A-like [Mercenaria mercenaria]